jgi:hypothetical protein
VLPSELRTAWCQALSVTVPVEPKSALPEPLTLHQWPCSLLSEPTYSTGVQVPEAAVPPTALDWSPISTPFLDVLNHSDTARVVLACSSPAGTFT